MPARFVWYDLITEDKAAARAFYTAVTGWSIAEWQGPQDYGMWTAEDGRAIGGLASLEGVASHWTSYVTVEDVDASAARAEALGGTLLRAPFDMEGVGRAAVVADPTGASLSVFRPVQDSPPPAADANPNGTIGWRELVSSDPELAVPFWFRLLGWTDVDTMQMPMGRYLIYGVDRSERGLGGMYQAPPGVPSHWLYYVTVADLDAALAAVGAHGGTVVNGPMTVPDGARVAQCLDPEGVPFALHAR